MKKIIELIFKNCLILVVLFGYVFSTINVEALTIKNGTTLADLRANLKALQKEKKDSENAKKKTQNEINAAENKIGNAKNEIDKANIEINVLGEEIDKTNIEIEELKKKTESLLLLYQKFANENEYVTYITGANDMTELIMRMDAIGQLTEYNEEQINNLELLIRNNKKMSKELENYQVSLNSKIETYEANIESLGRDLAEIVEGAESIDSEIQGVKELISYYEKVGCKEDEDLVACVNIANNTGWIRPLTKGKITSPFGWRIHPTKGGWKFHNGIDIGGNGEGTKIYSSAAGIVGKITRKSSCGGNMVYIWVYVKGVPYTVVYMHLLDIYVNVGDSVTTSTVIGTVGGGAKTKSYDKCSTGAHLHYGVSKNNHYLKSKSETYSKFTANMIDPPNFPSYGSWFYSR